MLQSPETLPLNSSTSKALLTLRDVSFYFFPSDENNVNSTRHLLVKANLLPLFSIKPRPLNKMNFFMTCNWKRRNKKLAGKFKSLTLVSVTSVCQWQQLLLALQKKKLFLSLSFVGLRQCYLDNFTEKIVLRYFFFLNIGTSPDLNFALFLTDTRGRIAILEIVNFLPVRPVLGHFLGSR